MTIAAGFKCQDGIVLATDLEITESMIKRSGRKSAYFKVCNGGYVGIAGAGSYDLVAYACEAMERNVRGNDYPGVVEVLRKNLKRLYHEHIRPSYAKEEWAYALQLIVGVQLSSEYSLEYGLFVSERSVLRKTGPYEFAGAGRDLAYYVMKKISREKSIYPRIPQLGSQDPWEDIVDLPDIENTSNVAKQLICEVGENVGACGREAAILKLPFGEEPSFF